MDTPNPFTSIRASFGDSTPRFALRTGVSIAAIWSAEHGLTRRPIRLTYALSALGHDPDALTRQYDAWLADVARLSLSPASQAIIKPDTRMTKRKSAPLIHSEADRKEKLC